MAIKLIREAHAAEIAIEWIEDDELVEVTRARSRSASASWIIPRRSSEKRSAEELVEIE
jgi:predicted membrane GTPase involved in stress response